MPDGWTDAALGDVAEIAIGRTPPRDEPRYWTNDLTRPFCTIADMGDGTILPGREGVTEAAEVDGKAKRMPAGSLLLSFKLTIGRVGIAGVDLFPNEAIARVEPKTDRWTSNTSPYGFPRQICWQVPGGPSRATRSTHLRCAQFKSPTHLSPSSGAS